MALNAHTYTYDLNLGQVELTSYRDSRGYSDGSVTLSVRGPLFHPDDHEAPSARVAIGSEIAELIATHLAEFAAGNTPSEDLHFTESEIILSEPFESPDSDSEDDAEDPDPSLLEDWITPPDLDGDRLHVRYRTGYQEGHISALGVNGEVAFLTPEAVEGVILRLNAHLTDHRVTEQRRQREEAELSEARGKWTSILYPGYIYHTAPAEYQHVVDRAVEFERTGERELPF